MRKRQKKSRRRRNRGGYALGFEHGYDFGLREAIVRSCPPLAVTPTAHSILFVTSGQGEPYYSLEQAITSELRLWTRETAAVSPFSDVLGKAIAMRPDLVIVFNGLNYFSPDTADAIRASGIRTAVWFTDDPYYTDASIAIAAHYDCVITNEINCVPVYKEAGCSNVHHMAFAADRSLFYPQHVGLPHRSEICFIGSGYQSRLGLIDAAASYLSRKQTFIFGRWWQRLAAYEQIKHRIHEGWMGPLETAAYYNGAHIVINLHRTHDEAEVNANARNILAASLNPRTFEIAAAGALQMVDERADLARFYEPGKEIVTFSSPQELIDKAEYYLHNRSERQAVAMRGLQRTLRDHTYRHRINELIQRLLLQQA